MPVVVTMRFLNESTPEENCAARRLAFIAEILREQCEQIPTSLKFFLESGVFTGPKRGVRIAQVAVPKLKASFNFVKQKGKREAK